MMKQKLIADYVLLEKQLFWLDISYTQCSHIGIKDRYTVEEFGYFETLCSRYSRGIDFLIRKIFRTLDEYEFENQGTLIDVVNHAHKRNLFQSIDQLRLMKDMRNSIAHEYIEDHLVEFFADVLEYTQCLMTIMQNTQEYIRNIRQNN
jgi:predicted house-cleaning noncanonical NTP pyrophosphatase (MazG superfamily)